LINRRSLTLNMIRRLLERLGISGRVSYQRWTEKGGLMSFKCAAASTINTQKNYFVDENGGAACESAPEKKQQKDRPSRSVAIRRLM
jgi:hypothetical protein